MGDYSNFIVTFYREFDFTCPVFYALKSPKNGKVEKSSSSIIFFFYKQTFFKTAMVIAVKNKFKPKHVRNNTEISCRKHEDCLFIFLKK